MATKKKAVKKSAAKKVTTKKGVKKKIAKKPVVKKVAKKISSRKANTKKLPSTKSNTTISSKHIISSVDGANMVNAFTALKGNMSSVIFYSGREFDISLFEALLQVNGIKKIRFRNALNTNNEHTLVVTGVNENGGDLYLPSAATKTSQKMSLDGDNPPPPTNGVGDMGDQCSDPKYKP